MQSTALLELKLVESGPFPTQAAAAQSTGGRFPHIWSCCLSSERDAPAGSTSYYVVQRVASITGRDLKGAYPSRDENGRPAVSFNLNADGAQRFGLVTESEHRETAGHRSRWTEFSRLPESTAESRIPESSRAELADLRRRKPRILSLVLAIRCPAGIDQISRRRSCRSLAWRRLDSGGPARLRRRAGIGHCFHVVLLPVFRGECDDRHDPEPDYSVRCDGVFRCSTDVCRASPASF